MGISDCRMVLKVTLAILASVALSAANTPLQGGAEYTGQFNDPETSSEHPLLRVHINGTLLNLPSYEPAGIEPNLDPTGPVSGQLVHHVNANGEPDMACSPAKGKDYTGKIVLVKRG